MTDRQLAVYAVILDLIYDHGGETPDDPRHVASYFSNMGQAAARSAIQQLVNMGKLFRIGDMLHQKRAENEAKTREKLSENRAEIGRFGGISSGKTRRDNSKNKEIGEANASRVAEAEKEVDTDKKEREVNLSRARDETALCIAHFNAVAERVGWPQVQKITGPRKASLAHRIADCGGADAWCGAMDRAALSPLLTGQSGRGWRADFDWLCKPANFTKLMEGNYDPRPTDANGHATDRQKFGAAINRLADDLTAGVAKLDYSSRDPFAARPRGHA